MAGPIVKRVPALKSRLARAASSVAAPVERASFTAEQAKESLEHSLAELKTDHIDVWLLHDVEASDLKDDSLLRFLQGAVGSGKVGTFGVGTDIEKIPALLAEHDAFCDVLQYEWAVLNASVLNTDSFRIHHRALTNHFRRLHEALVVDTALCRRWSERTGADLGESGVLARLMLKASLVENPDSVILFSSKSADHMKVNVRVCDDATLVAPAKELHALVQSEGFPAKVGVRA